MTSTPSLREVAGRGKDIFWNYTLKKKIVQMQRIETCSVDSLAIHLLNNWGLAVNESIHKDCKLKRIHKEVNIPL